MATKEKLTLYFSAETVAQAKAEAERQDRSISWIMQMAWQIAHGHLQQMPGIDELTPTLPAPEEGASVGS